MAFRNKKVSFKESYPQFKKYGKFLTKWNKNVLTGTDFCDLEIDATGKIGKKGMFELGFLNTGSKCGLEISSVKVYKNGNLIIQDVHTGLASENYENNIYSFKINEYETGAAFRIVAKVKSKLATDSPGVVFIK